MLEASAMPHAEINSNANGSGQWPAALDAVIAAPRHHRLIMENHRVRVLETRIAPGERTAVHTHQWPMTIHVLSWSDFVRYDDKGNVMLDSRHAPGLIPPPRALWSEPMPPHALENVGTTELRVVSVELKD